MSATFCHLYSSMESAVQMPLDNIPLNAEYYLRCADKGYYYLGVKFIFVSNWLILRIDSIVC
jgi:hypothetical protein